MFASWLQVTGVLDENTPIGVIQEIAESRGLTLQSDIPISWMVDFFNTTATGSLRVDDYAGWGRFLNPRSPMPWTPEGLSTARAFFQQATEAFHSNFFRGLPMGPLTEATPRSLNHCLLYRLGRLLGTPMTRATDLYQVFQGTEDPVIINELPDFPAPADDEIPELRATEFPPFYEADDDDTIPDLVDNAEEGPVPDNYNLNPEYSYPWLSIEYTFSPRLQERVYTPGHLSWLAQQWGLSETQIAEEGSVYAALRFAYLTNNFHPGARPGVENTHTPVYLTPLTEIPPELWLCFGYHDNIDNHYQATTYAELTETFLQRKALVNPCANYELLTSSQLRWLRKITETHYAFDTPEVGMAKRDLLRALQSLETQQQAEVTELSRFLHHYRELPATEQEALRGTFQRLWELALAMRGWLHDAAPWPLEHAPVEDQVAVDLRVTEKWARFEEADLQTGRRVSGLPLYRYTKDHYERGRSSKDGLTITQRLHIIRRNTTIEACIRMSSNWLAASANYYWEQVTGKPFCDITRLASIA